VASALVEQQRRANTKSSCNHRAGSQRHRFEVIIDGVTANTLPLTASATNAGDPGKRYETTVDVAATQSKPRHWVIFHAKGDGDLAPIHPGKKPFAVSNPIFFP